jgi:hypothetical protein
LKKRTIIISPLGTRKRRDVIFQHITSQCPDHDYSPVLYLTLRKFNTYLKDVCMKKAYIPFQSFTLNSLCRNLYEIYGAGSIVSDQVGLLVFCEILGDKNAGHARFL